MELLFVLLDINKHKALWIFLIIFLGLGLVFGTIFLIRYCSIRLKESSKMELNVDSEELSENVEDNRNSA